MKTYLITVSWTNASQPLIRDKDTQICEFYEDFNSVSDLYVNMLGHYYYENHDNLAVDCMVLLKDDKS